MKKYLRMVIVNVVSFFRKIFPFLQVVGWRLRINQLYSVWKCHEFKSSGGNAFIQFPIYLHGGTNISIGENFSAGLRLRLEAFNEHLGYRFTPSIIIGDNVSINHDCHICAISSVIIEDDVLIASKVFITDHYHGEITRESVARPPSKRKLFSKGPVKIEKNVWIGEGVSILPGVIIGKNSIIGANSVITRDISENSVVAGNPARVIRIL